jgi:NitT/TauT family transport system permease protein
MVLPDVVRPAEAEGRPVAVLRRLASLPLLGSLNYVLVPMVPLAVWELFARLEIFPKQFFPSPLTVVRTWLVWTFGSGRGMYVGSWGEAALASAERVFLGFAISATIAVCLGILMGYFSVCFKALDPIIQLLRPIPTTAWIPMAILFFGFEVKASIFLITYGSFFPIVLNTMAGVQRVDQVLLKVGRMCGASNFQLLRYFVFPAALPYVFTGLRLGLGVSWVLIVVAEMLAVFYRYDIIVGAMISIGFLGFLSDRLLLAVERRVLRWRKGVGIHG